MNADIFVRLDADNIGDAIELSLINNDISNAKFIHQKVQSGIMFIEKMLSENENCTLLMKGCDDILFKIKNEKYSETILIDIKNKFFTHSGYTISIGVGYSLEEVLLNLRKAKFSGKNRIISNIDQ